MIRIWGRMTRVATSAGGVALGTALVLGAAAPLAGAQGGGSCTKIEATLTSIQSALPTASAATLGSKIAGYASQLETEAASGSASVRGAVGAFVTQLKAAASGTIDVPKLTSDAQSIATACAASAGAVAPTGAPATGSGSTAGLEDGGLLLGGSAAVLAGGTVLAVDLRRRRRAAL